MPRARNIKPSFFKNDLLSDQEPLGRLLFIGMWTICDYQGCLEWRPKRVKAEILPYDDCDVEDLAINLDKSGFIRFYSDGEKMFVKVVNFTAHQNPHKNERQSGSDIPDYTDKMRQLVDLKGLTINRDNSGLKPEKDASDPADSFSLIPESPILNPDSVPAKPSPPAASKTSDLDYSSWPAMPSEQTLKDWHAMRKRIKANVSQTVINNFSSQLAKSVEAGFTVDECLSECVARNWRGFKFEWMVNAVPKPGSKPVAARVDYTPEDYSRGINEDGTF